MLPRARPTVSCQCRRVLSITTRHLFTIGSRINTTRVIVSVCVCVTGVVVTAEIGFVM